MNACDICSEFCQISDPDKEWKRYKEISVTGEHRTKYVRKCNNANAAAFTVDGGLIPSGTRNRKCDKLVLIERDDSSCLACFVELKSGSDLKRAITQLTSTLKEKLFDGSKFSKRECVIVYGFGIPRNRPCAKWENMQLKFMRETNCDIRKIRNGEKDNRLNS